MNFYLDKNNVNEYIEMCKDFDASAHVEFVVKNLNSSGSLLEIGSGPGNDLPELNKHYSVTASDYSPLFLKAINEQHPQIPTLQIDAKQISCEHSFDVVYSNKVLHHLTIDELKASLVQQAALLNQGGRLAHCMWIGEEDFVHEGNVHKYYTKEEILELITGIHNETDNQLFQVESFSQYEEFSPNDSALIILKLA